MRRVTTHSGSSFTLYGHPSGVLLFKTMVSVPHPIIRQTLVFPHGSQCGLWRFNYKISYIPGSSPTVDYLNYKVRVGQFGITLQGCRAVLRQYTCFASIVFQ